MSIPKSEHKVYIYKDDYNAMCTEVYKHQHIETGGNLFGLWTTTGSAVIHVVLGPGQDCRRTNTSFHQDIQYMHRVGRFVNDSYMLCHIGEWHSHHSLSLSKPSHGDEQTIERNFPKGMSKFLVIIANIKNRDTIVLSPYFFTDGGKRYEKAEYKVLESENPFLKNDKILEQIELGAEGKACQRNETNHGGASLTGTEDRRNAGSNSQRNCNTSRTYSQAVSTGSQNPGNAGSKSQRDDNTSSTHTQATSTNSQTSGVNADEPTPMETSDTESPGDRTTPPADHTSSQASNNPPGGSKPQNETSNGEGEKASMKDDILREIYDDLKKFFGGEGEVEIERTNHGDVQMTFKHDRYHWMLRLPETFPNQPAQLFSAHNPERLSNLLPHSDVLLEKPLTNHVNILLSIKKNCWSLCKICKYITKENLTKPATATSAGDTRLEGAVNALTNEIKMTLATPLQFTSKAQSDGSYKIEFEHYQKQWSIELPTEFPDKPAEVYKQESRFRDPEKKTIRDSSKSRPEDKPLVSSELIMLAIRSNCVCSQCYRIQ